MKKRRYLWVLLAAVLALGALFGGYTAYTLRQEVVDAKQVTSTLDGVSMVVKSYAWTPFQKSITVEWSNETDQDLLFGEQFALQKMRDGEWEPYNEKDLVFTTIGILLPAQKTVEHTYDLFRNSAFLSDGTYRIVADFHDQDTAESYEISMEFIVQ